MVMHHFARTLDAKGEVWISAIEHPCVHESSKHYFGKRAKLIPVTHDGVIDLDWLTAELADTRPGLVGVMAANNETGVIQPWREALAICRHTRCRSSPTPCNGSAKCRPRDSANAII